MPAAMGLPGDERPANAPRASQTQWRIVGAIGVCLVACLWFLTLDARHLLPADEGRYAEIAREMLASGDWVTIRYDGLKYFEKPPFQLWITALAFGVFGVGEWQARLWVACSGAAALLMTALATRRWFGRRVALYSALVLLAAPGWNLASHFNSLDMGVSAALTFVLAGVLIGQHPSTTASERRLWMWASWTAMAVAVLTKGLIGIVLPGMVLVVYSLLSRDFAIWRRIHLVSGALLMLALAAPWFVLVSLRNPEFAKFFFIHEHFQRYLSTVHHRDAAWWFFIPQLVAGFLPWLGLSRRMAIAVRDEPRGQGFRPALLVATWAVTIFVFFSVSSSKLPGYILPVYPALAILAALGLDKLDARAWNRQVAIALALAVIAFAATPLLGRLGSDTTPTAIYREFVPWVEAACLAAVFGILVAWLLAARDPGRSIAVYALAIFAAATLALRGHEVFGRSSSGVDLVAPMREQLGADTPIYFVRLLDHTLPFYLRRLPVLVEDPGELQFGVEQEPDKWLPTLGAFEVAWSAPRHALAVMAPGTFMHLKERGLPMTVIAEDPRRIVVAKPRSSAP
jgi:4-amino-4-deoxy-L-arabinose transferase-like glycosyltransferase